MTTTTTPTADTAALTEQISGTTATKPGTAVATKKPETALDTIKSAAFQAEINASLPRHIDAATFVRHASTLVAQNPALLEIARGGKDTDPHSIVRGVARAAALGLDLDPALGQAWLVPRKTNDKKTAVFQVGYKGYLELARRSGKITRIEVERIYSKDVFDARKGSENKIVFQPNWFADRGELIGWYALAELEGGVVQWIVVSKAEVEAHRDRFAGSKGPKSSWAEHFEAMGDKTAFLKLARWLPQSTEIAEAMHADEDAVGIIGVEVTPDEDVIDVDAETGEILQAAEVVG